MDLQKSNMTVLAQIVKLIPAKIIDSFAKKYKIQIPRCNFKIQFSAAQTW